MQAVLKPSPAQNLLHLFGGRNYMMRSEKRSGMIPNPHPAPSGNKNRPPKRRRKRAGFFYKIATMLLLIVLWPAGLVLLWRRKLRWNISTKLMVCIVTLVACIVLYGFALTVDTGNLKYAAIQDSVSMSLDSAADWLNGAGAYIGERADEVYDGASNLADALWQSYRSDAADLIDEGVKIADQVRDRITGQNQPTATAAPTEEPTEEPTAAPTKAPTSKPTKAPTAAPKGTPAVSAAPDAEAPDADVKEVDKSTGATTADPTAEATKSAALPTDKGKNPVATAAAETAKPTATTPVRIASAPDEKPIEAKPTEEPTEAPTAKPTKAPTAAPTEAPTAAPTEAPTEAPVPTSRVYVPTSAPDAASGKALTAGTLAKDGTFTEFVEPEPQPVTIALKPAKDAKIYYNNGGKYYHIASKCKGMKKAKEHIFGEVADTKLEKCPNCACPEKDLLDEIYVLWLDKADIAHVSDACSAFSGQYRLIRASDADESIVWCSECGADLYRDALANGVEIVIGTADDGASTKTEVEAIEPAEAEPTPAVEEIVPAIELKAAGEAPVYHSRTGKWYHTFGTCSGMSYASVYTLAECVDDYKCCNACKAPKPELVNEHCLWQDKSRLCHTSDECTEFQGRYTLVPRDTALEKGFKGCTICGADEYLIPGTTIRYPVYDDADSLDALLPAAS